MIDLEPNDELSLVRDTARKFAADHLVGGLRDAERARDVATDVRAAHAGIGLATLELPEALGGAGLGALARVLVNEELAAGDVGAAFALDPLGPAAYPLLETGAGDALAARASAGRLLLAASLDGPVSISSASVDARVDWVPAERADAVVAVDDARIALVTSGFEITPLRGAGLRAAGAGALRIDAATPEHVWEDAAAISRARARARLYVASLLLGVMRAACEFSCDYAQQREAFGRPIGHHQALAFRITEMRIAVDAARMLVHQAAWRVDRGLPAGPEAASAFAECIEAARSIGPDGVQILGGHGFMADYPVEKHMREARALGLMLGGYDAAVDEAGRALCDQARPLSLLEAAAL